MRLWYRSLIWCVGWAAVREITGLEVVPNLGEEVAADLRFDGKPFGGTDNILEV